MASEAGCHWYYHREEFYDTPGQISGLSFAIEKETRRKGFALIMIVGMHLEEELPQKFKDIVIVRATREAKKDTKTIDDQSKASDVEPCFVHPLHIDVYLAADEIVDSYLTPTETVDLRTRMCVFLNFKEIQELNKLLLVDLNKLLLVDLRARQEQQPVVESIGDVFLPHIAGFEQAYSRYIPRIALSEFAYKKEAAQNPTFKAFL
ncbi:hypothetical protein BGZ95_004920, partial [Linnemannia exigua]